MPVVISWKVENLMDVSEDGIIKRSVVYHEICHHGTPSSVELLRSSGTGLEGAGCHVN